MVYVWQGEEKQCRFISTEAGSTIVVKFVFCLIPCIFYSVSGSVSDANFHYVFTTKKSCSGLLGIRCSTSDTRSTLFYHAMAGKKSDYCGWIALCMRVGVFWGGGGVVDNYYISHAVRARRSNQIIISHLAWTRLSRSSPQVRGKQNQAMQVEWFMYGREKKNSADLSQPRLEAQS